MNTQKASSTLLFPFDPGAAFLATVANAKSVNIPDESSQSSLNLTPVKINFHEIPMCY